MDSDGSSRLNDSVLVLNRLFMAMHITTARRAFTLLYKNAAEVVHEEGAGEDSRFSSFPFDDWVRYSTSATKDHSNGDTVRTPNMVLLVPRVIRLTHYDRMPRRDVKFNRKNILLRDGYRCQYCGRKLAPSKLSIDHITPRSRKGKTSWENVVTACNDCNTKKGGNLPEEIGMRLLSEPVAPKKNPVILKRIRSAKYQIWRHFVEVG